MKKKIPFYIVFGIEVVLFILYFAFFKYYQIDSLAWINTFYDGIKSFLTIIAEWINFSWFQAIPLNSRCLIVLIILSALVYLLYFLIFYLVQILYREIMAYELKKGGIKITLSMEEKNRFSPALYESRFPFRRLFSLVFPLLFVYLFFALRFDKTICLSDEYYFGYFDFTFDLRSYIGGLEKYIFQGMNAYISFANQLHTSSNGYWLEWTIIVVAIILLLVVWWAVFTAFATPFRYLQSRIRANDAKNTYIIKLERVELETLKETDHDDEVSQKVKVIDSDNNPLKNTENTLSSIGTRLDSDNVINEERNSQLYREYLDDISTGVTDLGVAEDDTSEIHEPIQKRQTHFVGDEEVSITLEKEPMIETIDEVEEDYVPDEVEEETFNRYQSEVISNLEIEDKIKKYDINMIKEGNYYKDSPSSPSLIVDYEEKDIIKGNDLDLNQEEIIDENPEVDSKFKEDQSLTNDEIDKPDLEEIKKAEEDK